MESIFTKVAGIDVSLASLDICLLPSQRKFVVANGPEQQAELVAQLQAEGIELVCLEATGGLERGIVKACHQAGMPVAVINPRQIRDFAKALNRLAKTDRLDAHTIALFAERLRPRPQAPCSENVEKLRAFQARRMQVVGNLTQERNRLARTADPQVIPLVQESIEFLEQQLQRVEQQLQKLIDGDPHMRNNAELLQTVPGIGATTAAAIVVQLPELGTLDRRQVAKLLGVAPTNRDSGTLRGKRMTGGGRKELRQRLFMPTLVAVKYNPLLRNFYQRLIQNGKPKMVAIIATLRKLIVILNAMIKNQKSWNYNSKID